MKMKIGKFSLLDILVLTVAVVVIVLMCLRIIDIRVNGFQSNKVDSIKISDFTEVNKQTKFSSEFGNLKSWHLYVDSTIDSYVLSVEFSAYMGNNSVIIPLEGKKVLPSNKNTFTVSYDKDATIWVFKDDDTGVEYVMSNTNYYVRSN